MNFRRKGGWSALQFDQHWRVIAREKQRDQLGGGAITDGETQAKIASGNGPLSNAKGYKSPEHAI
jgi:hypothetical protein